MSDDVQIVLTAAAWATGVGIAGIGVGYLIRRLSLLWLITLVAVVGVAAVVAGVIGTSEAMFISDHDFHVVLLVCAASGVVSALLALAAGAAVVQWSRGLQDSARRFGESGTYVNGVAGPAEFTRLSEELARASTRLRDARVREARLEESRRELVSWVSHDLRTPLAGLRAMAESLEDGLAEDPSRYHQQMLVEVDRMVRMVDDLFELSRIHAGVLEPVLETVELGDLVSEALAGADPVARAVGVRIGGHVEQGLTLRADPAGLARVVSNLVTNAIRHTPAEGLVSIEGRACGDRVEISVTDQCGGIPIDELQRVFDVAWRGSAARTPSSPSEGAAARESGAGLGLAIVKGIVEAHRGHVRVSNELDGCRFLVELPVVPA